MMMKFQKGIIYTNIYQNLPCFLVAEGMTMSCVFFSSQVEDQFIYVHKIIVFTNHWRFILSLFLFIDIIGYN